MVGTAPDRRMGWPAGAHVGTTVPGVQCPVCNDPENKVVDSRTAEDGRAIRRRRECLACTHRFTTFERCDDQPVVVLKRSGARVPFEVEKVVAGVRSAAKGRPLTEPEIDDLAASVADTVSAGGGVVSSQDIGRAILERLRDLDAVTYVRFASVYKGFDDPADFEREVGLLAKTSPPKTT